MTNRYIIASHAQFSQSGEPIYGTGSSLEGFLADRKKDFLYIRFPLLKGDTVLVEEYVNTKKNYKTFTFLINFLPIKVIEELVLCTYFVLKFSVKSDVFIGIDPLNASYGIILKKLHLVKRVVFYTADYSPKRFSNNLLNNVYHWFDRYAVKNCDEVWNVSTRITDVRRKQGDFPSKNFFIPNSPEFKKIKRLGLNQISRHELVIVSTLSKSINFDLIFSGIKKISQKFPDVHLKIIGPGNWKGEFGNNIKKLNISGNVSFLQPMTHEKLMKTISRSAIGLALYTDDNSWTYFSDSMKARDYLACGLPVIITDVSSTADDIRNAKAGYVISADKMEFVKIVEKIFSNQKKFLELRKNAISLAKKFDIESILEKRLNI